MQDWNEFAQKNGLAIKDTGPCQLCNSEVSKGIIECIDIASQITHKLDHDLGVDKMTIFLCVDAHALQHSEIHGRWNNHYHLARLHLILKKNIKWNYKLSPLLSEVLDKYKVKNENEVIRNPMIGNRGVITVRTVNDSVGDDQYIRLVWAWADDVFNTFHESHDISDKISDLFLKRVFA